MATDIALALGVIAVAGRSVPPAQRAFLLGLATVDDIGAIVVIAVFYSDEVRVGWLAAAAACVIAAVLARRFGVRWTSVYVVVGGLLWCSLHEGDVHATIAGVVMGLLAPVAPHLSPDEVDVEELADLSKVEHVDASASIARRSVSIVEWLEHVLHPWTSYVIVPIFAFANAGIQISADGLREASRSAITWGIVAGLVAGKPVGVMLATRIAVRCRIADPIREPRPVRSSASPRPRGSGSPSRCSSRTWRATTRPTRVAILVASALAATLSALLLRGARTVSTG